LNNGTQKAVVMQIRNKYTLISNVTVAHFTAYRDTLGGGLAFIDYNEHTRVENCHLHHNHADGRGGAIDLGAYNNNFTMLNTICNHNSAPLGGSCLSERLPWDTILIENCSFVNNEGSASINANDALSNLVVKDSEFLYNLGGAVSGVAASTSIAYERVRFEGNALYGSQTLPGTIGAGVTIAPNSVGVSFTDCQFVGNLPITKLQMNVHALIEALQQAKESESVALINSTTTVDSLVRAKGGGIFIGQFSQVNVTGCLFVGNVAAYGGAIYLDLGATESVLYGNIIKNNTALVSGGGVYLFSDVKEFYMVGTRVTNNQALLGNGGGLFAHSKLKNLFFLDMHTYSQAVTVESSHPYESLYPEDGIASVIPIQNALVHIPGSSHLYVAFDDQTETWSDNDVVKVWADEQKTGLPLFIGSSALYWPGKDLNVLKVKGDKVFFEFTGPTERIVLDHGHWGFRARVIPGFSTTPDESNVQTIFANNSAPQGSGGGIHFFESISYPLFFNVEFFRNMARVGGGLHIDTLTIGLEGHNMSVHGNVAGDDGGGMYFSASNYAVQIIESSFVSNVAGVYRHQGRGRGGAVHVAANNGRGENAVYHRVTFSDTDFIGNKADQGGALYLFTKDIVQVFRANIMDNSVEDAGGAIYVGSQSSIFIYDSHIEGNSAGLMGGGVAMTPYSVMAVLDTTVLTPTLTLTLALITLILILILILILTLTLNMTQLMANTAGPTLHLIADRNEAVADAIADANLTSAGVPYGGGGIYGESAELRMGGHMVFEKNQATPFGGGILLRNMPIWRINDGAIGSEISFTSNFAGYGSAIAFLGVDFSEQEYFYNSTQLHDYMDGSHIPAGETPPGTASTKMTRNKAYWAGMHKPWPYP